MQTINKKVKELLGVLLPVDSPLAVKPTTEISEGSRHDHLYVVLPERPYQIRIESRHDTLRSLPVFLNIVSKPIVYEELTQHNGCTQALDRRIHITSDTKIRKARSRKLETADEGM